MAFWNDVKNDWRTAFTNKTKREEFIVAMLALFAANYCHIKWFTYDSFWKDSLILFAFIIVADILFATVWHMIKRIKNR